MSADWQTGTCLCGRWQGTRGGKHVLGSWFSSRSPGSRRAQPQTVRRPVRRWVWPGRRGRYHPLGALATKNRQFLFAFFPDSIPLRSIIRKQGQVRANQCLSGLLRCYNALLARKRLKGIAPESRKGYLYCRRNTSPRRSAFGRFLPVAVAGQNDR